MFVSNITIRPHSVRLRFPLRDDCVTNLNGLPIRFTFERPNMLEVAADSKRQDVAIVRLLLSDASGNDIDQSIGAWNARGFRRAIRPPRPGETITVAFALVRLLTVEFVATPSESPHRQGHKP